MDSAFGMLFPQAAEMLNVLQPRQEDYVPCSGLPKGCDRPGEKNPAGCLKI